MYSYLIRVSRPGHLIFKEFLVSDRKMAKRILKDMRKVYLGTESKVVLYSVRTLLNGAMYVQG